MRCSSLGPAAPGNGDIGALGGASIELAWPSDLLPGVGDHLVPLRDPPDGSGNGEQHREHGGRKAQRLERDPRVEVDVGVELLLDEIRVRQGDALQFHRHLQQRIVDDPQFLQDLVACALHDLGARLSQQLGVSRGPLREAIRTLEGRRIVERTPHSGARVTLLSIDDIENIMVTREALEAMACRQAAEHMSLHETVELRKCIDMLTIAEKQGNGGFQHLGMQDSDFHVQIARGSRNRWLAEILCRDLYALLCMVRFKAASVQGRLPHATAEHYEILDRIEKRDPDGAEQVMRKHILSSRISLLAQLRADPNFMKLGTKSSFQAPFRAFGHSST